MKSVIYKTCILCIIIFQIGCNSIKKNQESITIFSDSLHLKGETIKIKDLHIPFRLIVEDSLLIIVNKGSDYFFSIYNTHDMKLIYEFGKKGRGPNEFIDPEFTGYTSNYDQKQVYHFYDWKRRRFASIDFKAKLNDPNYAFQSSVMPRSIPDIQDVIFKNDSILFIAPDGEKEKGRFYIYNYIEKKMKIIPYLPKLPFKIHKSNLYPIYNIVSSTVNIEKKKIVILPNLLGQFDFFDLSGNYLHSTIIERDASFEEKASEKKLIKNTKHFGYEIKQFNSLIYALFGSMSPEEGCSNSIIFVMDWDGNPIKKYILDRPIGRFAIDTINNCIYGIDAVAMDISIIKYDLK